MKYNRKTLRGIYKRVLGSLSGLSDVSVVLEDGITPQFNETENVIKMPPVISYARDEDEDFFLGRSIMVHEVGHVLFAPSTYDIIEDIKGDIKGYDEWYGKNRDGSKDLEYLEWWFNVFFDVNNEFKVSECWPHLGKILKDKTEIIFELKPELNKCNDPRVQVLMRCEKLAVLNPIYSNNYEWKPFCERTVKKFNKREIHKANGKDLIDFSVEVWKDYIKEKKKLGNSVDKAIEQLIKDLGMAIKNKDNEEQQRIKEKMKKLQESRGMGGEYTKEIQELVNERDCKTQKKNFSNLDVTQVKAMLKNKIEKDTKGLTPSWGNSEVDLNTYVEEYDIKNLESDEIFDCDKNVAYIKGKKINNALKKKIQLQKDYEQRHRSGLIDLIEIRKQISQAGRITKETIFQRNTDSFTRGGEWAIEVLIDCSGSMALGIKMKEAKQALATLSYALEGLPNVKFALTGFTEYSDPLEIPIKRFKNKFNFDNLQLLSPLSGNCDGLNIRKSTKRLIKLGNCKKVLIVISDGQPAYTGKDAICGNEDTAIAVKQAKKYGVEVIGIGIEGSSAETIQEIYPVNYLFQNNETLCSDLTNLILSCLGQRKSIKLVKNKWVM